MSITVIQWVYSCAVDRLIVGNVLLIYLMLNVHFYNVYWGFTVSTPY